jgi:two-component system, oxyanion-binding sensor
MTTSPVFRIGLLRLTDAAPLIIARERGYFAAEDVEACLSVEPSWANIADKLSYGLLDGAMMLPPLALALGLGLSGGCGPEAIVVPAALSLNGNTVTLSDRWAGPILQANGNRDAAETARRFCALLRARRERPVLAVVHHFSTHNLLLRYWLASGGIDPIDEVSFTVVPPAETVAAMAAGKIDGFCAGAPWGAAAARAGLGRAVATSHAIWNHHTEKVFAVRRTIAEHEPARLQAVLRAVLRAASYCDAPENADAVAAILARDAYLNLPADLIRISLPGAFPGGEADVSVFSANAANVPWPSHAEWYLRELVRWGYVGPGDDLDVARAIFRPDLHAEAARAVGLSVPVSLARDEGRHGGSWRLPATPAPIPMGPDRFVDGAVFDLGERENLAAQILCAAQK